MVIAAKAEAAGEMLTEVDEKLVGHVLGASEARSKVLGAHPAESLFVIETV